MLLVVDFDRFPLIRDAPALDLFSLDEPALARRPDLDLPALLSDLALEALDALVLPFVDDLPFDRELRSRPEPAVERLDFAVDVSAVVPFVTFVLRGTRRLAEKLEYEPVLFDLACLDRADLWEEAMRLCLDLPAREDVRGL